MKLLLTLTTLSICCSTALCAPQITNSGGWNWDQRALSGISGVVLTNPVNESIIYTAKIDVLDGYVPHSDTFSVGDIKIRVHINDELIGSTRKIQDEERPTFNEHFMANVKGQDRIRFDIWDMDPGSDDFEGTFYTTCGHILSTGLNGTTNKYEPICRTSSSCFLNVNITCTQSPKP